VLDSSRKVPRDVSLTLAGACFAVEEVLASIPDLNASPEPIGGLPVREIVLISSKTNSSNDRKTEAQESRGPGPADPRRLRQNPHEAKIRERPDDPFCERSIQGRDSPRFPRAALPSGSINRQEIRLGRDSM
jgi:hypothetical protein